MVLLGIVVPILVFFITVNVTYAYFTARSAAQEGTTATGSVVIRLSTDTQPKVNSTAVTNSTKILPGDTLAMTGTLENAGTHSFYAIFEYKVIVTKAETGSTPESVLLGYYTYVNSTLTQIVKNEDVYSANAFLLEAANADRTNTFSIDFNIPYTFDGNIFDNDYKNATVTYSLKAVAIQSESIGGAESATAELIKMAEDWTLET